MGIPYDISDDCQGITTDKRSEVSFIGLSLRLKRGISSVVDPDLYLKKVTIFQYLLFIEKKDKLSIKQLQERERERERERAEKKKLLL